DPFRDERGDRATSPVSDHRLPTHPCLEHDDPEALDLGGVNENGTGVVGVAEVLIVDLSQIEHTVRRDRLTVDLSTDHHEDGVAGYALDRFDGQIPALSRLF